MRRPELGLADIALRAVKERQRAENPAILRICESDVEARKILWRERGPIDALADGRHDRRWKLHSTPARSPIGCHAERDAVSIRRAPDLSKDPRIVQRD